MLAGVLNYGEEAGLYGHGKPPTSRVIIAKKFNSHLFA